MLRQCPCHSQNNVWDRVNSTHNDQDLPHQIDMSLTFYTQKYDDQASHGHVLAKTRLLTSETSTNLGLERKSITIVFFSFVIILYKWNWTKNGSLISTVCMLHTIHNVVVVRSVLYLIILSDGQYTALMCNKGMSVAHG